MDSDDDGTLHRSSRTRKGQSAARERTEESSKEPSLCQSHSSLRNTSPRTSRDHQPGSSCTSQSRSPAPQRTNRSRRTLYLLQHPLHMLAPNRLYFLFTFKKY